MTDEAIYLFMNSMIILNITYDSNTGHKLNVHNYV